MTHLMDVVVVAVVVAGLTGFAALLALAVVSRLSKPRRYASPELLFRAAGERGPVTNQPLKDLSPARLHRSNTSRRYCLITPCRDEARFGRRTLEAVTRQSEPPALWVIVDDGSTDDTPALLAEYAARFPWIRVVRRADRGVRKLGGGVIDAFYTGYDSIDPSEFEYVCKLDLDLDLPPRYFELLMDWMEAYPRIGTCSGKPYFFAGGEPPPDVEFPLQHRPGLVSEKCGDENSVGMVKFYRTACFERIGGFVRELMWDGIDGHRCRDAGWIAISSDHPMLRFVHLRPMGTSHKNWWTGRVRHGYGQYYMGTTPAYMLASALYRMTRPPLVMGGFAMIWGYVKAMGQRIPRCGTPEFRRFVRQYQWASLITGKANATAALNARAAMRWVSDLSPGVERRPLGEILVHVCALGLDKLEEALAAQQGEYAGSRLGEILLRMRAVSRDELRYALAVQVGRPAVETSSESLTWPQLGTG